MLDRYQSIIVVLVSRGMVPAIQVFAFYVITHGHYSPGGGFQGGVLLAASIILLRLTQGREESFRLFPPAAAMYLAGIGVMVFLLTGLVPMALGGSFLDYAMLLSGNVPAATLRYYGILVIEVGVAMTVWGTLVTIFDQLGRETDDI